MMSTKDPLLKIHEEVFGGPVTDQEIEQFLKLCGGERQSRELTRDEDLLLRFAGPNIIEELRKLRDLPHLFMKGLFADQGRLHSSWCWCQFPQNRDFATLMLSWQKGTAELPSEERCVQCGTTIEPGTIAGFLKNDGRRIHMKCPEKQEGHP